MARGTRITSELITHLPTTDRMLRAKAGDAAAFEELLEPVLDPAFRLAMVMLRDRTAAEDAVQEAALKAWRNLGRFRPEAELRPWFLSIVANECRETRRSRWRRVLPLELGIVRASENPTDGADRLDLDAGLHRLHPRHLLPITLYYHLDLPIDEVARVLRCSPGAARVRIHRAIAALRPMLQIEVPA